MRGGLEEGEVDGLGNQCAGVVCVAWCFVLWCVVARVTSAKLMACSVVTARLWRKSLCWRREGVEGRGGKREGKERKRS
jgi:hypothetical protein